MNSPAVCRRSYVACREIGRGISKPVDKPVDQRGILRLIDGPIADVPANLARIVRRWGHAVERWNRTTLGDLNSTPNARIGSETRTGPISNANPL